MASRLPRTNAVSGKDQTVPTVHATLGAKRKQWLECIGGDDENALRHQIMDLLLDLREWWTINSALRFTPRDKNGELKTSRLLHGLLNRCFVAKQMMSVRRLCDDSYPFENQKKGRSEVWSLVSLLKDMKKHADLLTRGAIFDEEGVRYDIAAIQRDVEHTKIALTSGNGGMNCYIRSTQLTRDRVRSEQRHYELDLVTGVAIHARSEEDRIQSVLFDKMRSRVQKTCEDIAKKVHRFLAHAATPTVRPQALSSSETPAALFDAARVIKETVDFVSSVVLGSECLILPAVTPVDNLEHIECPLLCKEDIPDIRDVWNETGRKLFASFGSAGEFIDGL